jgi:signal transduction histidine kinase
LSIYRIVQEALTNTAKYAEASAVSVTLERRGATVVAIIEDNGKGFDVKGLLESRSTEGKLGLFGMQERAALIGGRLTIESEPGTGTTVFVEAPLELERAIV